MLEFYYDCIVKYFKPYSFELTETATDSIYVAINKETIDECINQKYKERFEKEIFTLVMMLTILNGFLGDVVPLILHLGGVRLVDSN